MLHDPKPRGAALPTAPAAQTSALKRWLPLAVVLTVMAVVLASGWHRYLTFESIALHREALRTLVASNLGLSLLIYALIYIASVALSLPGGLVLTVSGGLLFGVALGAPTAVVSATIGATVLFLIARTSLGAAFAERAGPWLDKFRKGFERNGLSYMLFLRLVPFPFFVINLAPAVLGVPLRTFVAGTFLGIIPGTLAFSFLGDTLDRVILDAKAGYDACVAAKGAAHCALTIELGQLPIGQILVALTLIGLVSLIPVALQKWSNRHATD